MAYFTIGFAVNFILATLAVWNAVTHPRLEDATFVLTGVFIGCTSSKFGSGVGATLLIFTRVAVLFQITAPSIGYASAW